MPVYVALLRGINVGGVARLPMAELHDLALDVGFHTAVTYVQSGNLVGRHPGSVEEVQHALQDALAEHLGVAVPVVVRTAAGLRGVVAANPFRAEATADPTKVHVTFHLRSPARWLSEIDLDPLAPEAAKAGAEEVYLSLPGGIGRSKLAQALARRAPKDDPGTTRNWRTVEALAQMVTEQPG